ncbi:MAG: maiA [Roseomonas sp.]|jgi:maleylpyruvate isomerase|nr:maiA [Roseomonas sp.]
MRLHGYARSYATWRVRIALALKNLNTELVLYDLPADGTRSPALVHLNPQGLVPVLEAGDGTRLTQSFAIVEWLEEMWPTPPLLPGDPAGRARVRGFAMAIVGDLNQGQSNRGMARLRQLGLPEPQVRNWMRQMLAEGLETCESLLSTADGPFCFGATPGLGDISLVPAMALARDVGLDLTFPRLLAAEAACLTLPAFHATCPLTETAPMERIA